MSDKIIHQLNHIAQSAKQVGLSLDQMSETLKLLESEVDDIKTMTINKNDSMVLFEAILQQVSDFYPNIWISHPDAQRANGEPTCRCCITIPECFDGYIFFGGGVETTCTAGALTNGYVSWKLEDLQELENIFDLFEEGGLDFDFSQPGVYDPTKTLRIRLTDDQKKYMRRHYPICEGCGLIFDTCDCCRECGNNIDNCECCYICEAFYNCGCCHQCEEQECMCCPICDDHTDFCDCCEDCEKRSTECSCDD